MIGVRLKYKGFVPGTAMAARAFDDALAAGFDAAGRYYFQQIRPKHFERAAHDEYGYATRSDSWIRRKIRKTSQATDLIFTGRSMQETRSATITATKKGVRVSMPAGMLLMHPRDRKSGPSPVNMQQEMEAISDRDRSDLVDIIERIVDRRLRESSATEEKYYGINSTPATSMAGFFHEG
jgi:hypothetical protein